MNALLAILLGAAAFTWCGVHVLDSRTPAAEYNLWLIGTGLGSMLGLYGLIANHSDHTRRR